MESPSTVKREYQAEECLEFNPNNFSRLINNIRETLYLFADKDLKKIGLSSESMYISEDLKKQGFSLYAVLPKLMPECLGDRSFQLTHKVRYCYVAGAMARGIASAKLVIALAKLGMLGFFGAAGLKIDQVEKEIIYIKRVLDPLALSYGVNLIHSPDQFGLEEKLVTIFLKNNVTRVSASAFMTLTKNIVWYAGKGLHQDQKGRIVRQNYVFAKISHPTVARQFLSPAPDDMLDQLVKEGKLTEIEARLARQVSVASDITVESDSGGHTDNRPLLPLFSAIKAVYDQLVQKFQYSQPVRIGAAGGLGTPESIASAFAMGASYVLIGSVHQSAVESGLSDIGKAMLAEADITDVMISPSADMFEMGVKVQVLKKGTMMGVRGQQLYRLYKQYQSIEKIPENIISRLEKQIFCMSITEVWQKTIDYFMSFDPKQIEKANQDQKHKMALIFRWYLGNTSRWPLIGDVNRKIDYQIWCGPAMGSFNQWVKGSFLEPVKNRKVQQIALNLLEGAAIITRTQHLRTMGLEIPISTFSYKPKLLMLDKEKGS